MNNFRKLTFPKRFLYCTVCIWTNESCTVFLQRLISIFCKKNTQKSVFLRLFLLEKSYFYVFFLWKGVFLRLFYWKTYFYVFSTEKTYFYVFSTEKTYFYLITLGWKLYSINIICTGLESCTGFILSVQAFPPTPPSDYCCQRGIGGVDFMNTQLFMESIFYSLHF
jgi:hypothetical protein